MVDRITLLLKARNISASQFADEIGVQRSSISHVLSGRNKPSLDFIQKILVKYPEINPDWLLFGKGAMNLEYNLFSELTEPMPLKSEALSKAIKRQERSIRVVSEPFEAAGTPEMPAVDQVGTDNTVPSPAMISQDNVEPNTLEKDLVRPVEVTEIPSVASILPEVEQQARPQAQQTSAPQPVPAISEPVNQSKSAQYTGSATMAALTPLVEKDVEQITIFYKDRTFILYKPG